MRALLQRVNFAKLKIDNQIHSQINKGYLVLLGIKTEDNEKDVDYVIKKLLNLKIFDGSSLDYARDDSSPQAKGYFNSSIQEIDGEILVASQFTLYADLDKGNKASFSKAMPPKEAEILYNKFIEKLKEIFPKVKTGVFAAYMVIELENDGPATFLIES